MAIEHQVEQGTPQWYALRLGVPTASQAHKILTPAKGDLSKQARGYAMYLLAEKLLQEPLESLSHLEYVSRGKELEPQAVAHYSFVQEVETRACGFFTTDDGRCGATPDRILIGQSGALECKCPSGQVHVSYLLDGFGADYRVQQQMQLLVCGLEFIDIYSYHPRLPPALVRSYRDEPFLHKLQSALNQFCDMLDEMTEQARTRGFFDARTSVPTPADLLAEQQPRLSGLSYATALELEDFA